jgi:protein-S-isoprenylcysteine O-methyltransferase Ste14
VTWKRISIPLWLRALSFLLIAPGTITVLVPRYFTGGVFLPIGAPMVGRVLAIVMMAAGYCVLLWCFRDFVRRGHGTPAPYDPPKKLVIAGLYQYTRNPMYVGLVIVLVGEALWSWSTLLLTYAAAVALAFHLRVLIYEEPKLTELFGRDFLDYRQRVSRWIPRISRRH